LFTGLGLLLFGSPALFGIIAIVIMFFYPLLKKSDRDAMYAEIEQRKLSAARTLASND
jgi:Na+/melibiose symporter-like transporter